MSKTLKDNAKYIVLANVGVPVITPGSVEMTAECGHAVWASESAQTALAEEPGVYETLCLTCFQESKDSSEDSTEYTKLPGSTEALSKTFGITELEAEVAIASAIKKLKAHRGSRP